MGFARRVPEPPHPQHEEAWNRLSRVGLRGIPDSGGFSWEGNCVVASSLKEMHRATGLATGTIHKAKSGLVRKGLVQILNTRNKERTNTYNLLPLRERLAEFAEWKLPATPEPKADEVEICHPNA